MTLPAFLKREPDGESGRRRAVWILVAALALIRAMLDTQATRPIGWDEAEFLRATTWIAHGLLPYRDFWEHHTPLQWFLFAPITAMTPGPGVAPFLAVRWAQLPLWLVTFALLLRISRPHRRASWLGWAPLLLLALTPAFELTAVEYRVDTVGVLLYVFAVALALRPLVTRARWVAIGVVLSCAVLANMRLAPLVVLTGVLMLLVDPQARRWRVRRDALWLGSGLAIALLATTLYIATTHSWAAVVECLFGYNTASDAAARGMRDSFWFMLLKPLGTHDFAAVLLWCGGLSGAIVALRSVRRPGPSQLIAMLGCATVASVYATALHYEYHFQLTYVFCALLSEVSLERLSEGVGPAWARRSEGIALIVVSLIVLTRFTPLPQELAGASVRRTDTLLRTIDHITKPGETVWDAAGYAYTRPSPYKYWFLPMGIRLLAARGTVPSYGAPQMAAAPPAAIWYSSRLYYWIEPSAALTNFVTHEYMPLHQEIWIPAMSAALPAGGRMRWVVPRSGRYRIYAARELLGHPWFHIPLQCGLLATEEFPLLRLDLRRYAATPEVGALRFLVNGAETMPGGGALSLSYKGVLDVESTSPKPLAVMIVPEWTHELFVPVDGRR